MPQFKLHWLNSDEPEVVEGPTIAEAMTLAGYGNGAVRALDHYEEIKNAEVETGETNGSKNTTTQA